jgi:hypothetical protein
MRFTPPRVFLTLTSALILTAAAIYLIFSNLIGLGITPVDCGLTKPDNHHSPSDYQYLSALCHF